MRPISTKNKKLLSNDPWMRQCARCGEQPVQWHHVTFLGTQLDEVWAIVPACLRCHKLVDTDKEIRKFFIRVALRRMNDADRASHPKWDWKQISKQYE